MADTTGSEVRPRRSLNGEIIVAGFALAMAALALFGSGLFNDPDTWWHVKIGDWILANGQAPRADHWSASKLGAPWTAHEWLSELLMGEAWRIAGWSGVAALSGAAAGLATWLLGRHLAGRLDGTALAAVMLVALSLWAPTLLARPHLLALPILVAWSAALVSARDRDAAPALWFAPLMTLWANLHGGYAFGLALIGPFALEALVSAAPEARGRVVVRWGLFGLASLACALATPFGIEGLLFPFKLLTLTSLNGIGEWRPADFSHVEPLEIALLALLAFALTRPLRLGPWRLLLLIGLIHLSLSHARHQMLLGVVGPMLLAAPLAETLGLGRSAKRTETPAAGRWAGAIVGLLGIALIAGRLAVPIVRTDSATAPMAALAAAPVSLRAQPVLNGYGFGGYLIWRGMAPFIDSRAELYQDAFLRRYGDLAAGDPAVLEATLAEHHIAWTLFAPGEPVVAVLDREPGWRRLYADRFAVIHVRK